MHLSRRSAALLLPALLTAAIALQAGPAAADPGGSPGHARPVDRPCRGADTVAVPGAEKAITACLADLTTTGLQTEEAGRYTDVTDWTGLHQPGNTQPSGVRGLQVDGYFPDTSHLNTEHGWNHDAQFVLRIPDHWNGELVVTGAPGTRKQYAGDYLFSDYVLAQGFAYASTDKGNNGPNFYTDGTRPGDVVAEWNSRVTQLTVAAQKALKQRYGHAPGRTYMAGISNGGYLVRWQLENRPELYDGGLDWEGTLFTPQGPDLFTYLPTAIRFQLGEATAEDMYAAGFARGSEKLWPYHETVYWGLTQKTYRAEFDPAYDPTCPGTTAGGTLPEILAPCPSDTHYDAAFADRSRAVHAALARVSLTGRIGKPMLTLHGTLDSLLPISTDSDVYDAMIAGQHRDALHRYYRIVGGNHVDSLVGVDPETVRTMLPCARTAFDALTAWVEHRVAPPADATVPRPAGLGTTDPGLLNSCSLAA